eukprot:g5764.t1
MLQTHMWSIVPSKNITYRKFGGRADEWFSVTDIFQKGDQKMEALPPGVQESEHLRVLRDVFTPELGQNKTRTCREVYVEQLKKRDHTVGALAVKIDLEGLDLKCFRDILGTAPALAVVSAKNNNKGSTPSLASTMTSSTLLPRVISIEVFSAEVAMESIRTAVRKGYRWIKFVEQSAYFRLICNPRIRGRDGVYGAPRTQRRIFSDNGYRISRIEKGPECYAESGSGPLGDNALDYITGPEWRRLDDDSLTSSPRRHVNNVNGGVQGGTEGAAGEALACSKSKSACRSHTYSPDDSSSAGGAPRKRKSKLAEHGEAMRLAKTGTSDPTPSSTWTEICVFLLALFVGFYGLSCIVEPYPNDCPRQIQQCLHLGGGKEEVQCPLVAGSSSRLTSTT